jgi:prophage antirepressor-like protein
MTAIQIFESPDFGNMRVTDRNGQEWYCSADVCRACGIANSRDAVSRLDEDERITLEFPTVGNSDGRENTGNLRTKITFVSEPGLYSLILTSNKPEAKAFKRWITHEVIPSIRKTGFYVSTKELHRRDEIIDRLEDELHLLRQQVNGLRNGHGSFQLWDVAQHLRKNGIGNGNDHKLVLMMVEQGLLQKDTSIKKRGLYRPFLKDIRAGYFDHELTHNGQPAPVWKADICVTAKGLDWIIHTFLSLRHRKWEQERPMITHSRVVQRRLAELSPEVGGPIFISDECGSREAWID